MTDIWHNKGIFYALIDKSLLLGHNLQKKRIVCQYFYSTDCDEIIYSFDIFNISDIFDIYFFITFFLRSHVAA